MQEARNETATRTRRKRRALLALLVMAASPALAESPPVGAIRMLPPLPLQAIEEDQSIKTNEFCPPQADNEQTPVQLASGPQRETTIRLKPVGQAVGLRSIDGEQPSVLGRSAIKIEEVLPAGIRFNPLVQEHPTGEHPAEEPTAIDESNPADLSEANNAQPSAAMQSDSLARQDDTDAASGVETAGSQDEPVFFSLSDAAQEAEAASDESADDSNASGQSADREVVSQDAAAPIEVVRPAKLMPVPVQPIAVPAAEIQAVEPPSFEVAENNTEASVEQPADDSRSARDERSAVAAAPIAQDPVSPPKFDDDATPAQTMAAPRTPARPPASAVAAVEREQSAANTSTLSPARSSSERAATGGAIQLDVVAPIRLYGQPVTADSETSESPAPRASLQRFEPETASPPVQIRRGQPAVHAPVEAPRPQVAKPARPSQRYRPPVAVPQLPLAGARPDGTSPNHNNPSLHAVQAIALQQSDQFTAPEGAVLTPLQLAKAEVRSLTVAGKIIDVQILDKTVCQAFHSSSNQLKLVGVERGVTRLMVKAEATDASEPQARLFEIKVTSGGVSPAEEMQRHAVTLNQSIAVAFPQCRVNVTPHQDRLLVTGYCDSDDTARQIMRMVRKACLIPARDQLQVR